MSSSKDAKQAIGLFDSGIGGLTVLDSVQKILPVENLIYVADSAHAVSYTHLTLPTICSV